MLTVEQARTAFTSAGYQVDRAYTWDWTSPPVTSFRVQDPSTSRILMVLVYPSGEAALTSRLQATNREQALQPDAAGALDVGPHLVVGYGNSTWNSNVALVQTTEAQLDRMFQAQADRDNGVSVNPAVADDPGLPNLAVDLDFQQALQSGAVNL
jgi:hypothetical protein